jgi:hypothetical protein
MPDSSLSMLLRSLRAAGFAAGVLLLSCAAERAHAQIYVLNGLTDGGYSSAPLESSFVFNSSMILNSIGFTSGGYGLTSVSYTLNNVQTSLSVDDLTAVDASGLRWYNFANGGLSVNASSVLKVATQGTLETPPMDEFMPPQDPYYTNAISVVGSRNSSSNVTWNGLLDGSSLTTTFTNSNLRVSNPSANVAPEPGTFALALTGGVALLGICIRRRRNAA